MNKERGVIGTIILIVIGLGLAGYFFDFNIIEFLKSDAVQNIWDYTKRAALIIWENFLRTPVIYIWQEVVIDIIWENIVRGADIVKDWVDANDS